MVCKKLAPVVTIPVMRAGQGRLRHGLTSNVVYMRKLGQSLTGFSLPRIPHLLHGRRAHDATATVLRDVTCPSRAAAVRPGPAPDSAGWPAWGRSRAPGPNAAPPASDSETACHNRGNAPARIRWY